MKTSFFIGLLALSCLGSCKKESPNTPRSGMLSAEINSVYWSATAKGYKHTGIGNRVKLSSEYNADGSRMEIFMPEDSIGVFDAVDGYVVVVFDDGTNSYSWNISGTITVLANSPNKVEGTFDIKAMSFPPNDTIDLRQGAFYWQRD